MIDMFMHSIILFFKGKLFRDLGHVARQSSIGIAIAAVILIGLVKVGLTLWIAILITAFIAGIYQPWLFKDLKYA